MATPPSAGAPTRASVHLGVTLAKLGSLDARFPCPEGWSPPKPAADFVTAASAASANDRLTVLDASIADLEKGLVTMKSLDLDSSLIVEKLDKHTAEREKLGKLPQKGLKAAAHRWEQASSKARAEAEERMAWEERGALNATKRLQDDLDALDAAATEIASRRLAVTAAHAKSAQAWTEVAALKAAYDKEVVVCFQEKAKACSTGAGSEDVNIEENSDAFSEVAEDAADESCPLHDLCLRVDLVALGPVPSLVLSEASAAQRTALDALHAAFQSIPEDDIIPHCTYSQLGLVDAAHAAMVTGMIGADFWNQLYGSRNITEHHWVPTQMANFLRKQVERVMAQLPADVAAVRVAKERMEVARVDAQRVDRTRRGPY